LIGHIFRSNRLLHDDIDKQITEQKEIGRKRRRIQLLDDLRNRRIYLELKVEAED